MRLPPERRAFIYVPFQHAETLDDQARSVTLFTALGNPNNLDFALRHQSIIARWPLHRNRARPRLDRSGTSLSAGARLVVLGLARLLDRNDRVRLEPISVFAGFAHRLVARDA
jgi:hypothetical protein